MIESSGWLVVALAAGAAAAGIALRRFKNAPALLIRMRPHFILGYASLLVAALHMWSSFPVMGMVRGGEYANGLDAATIALLLVGAQTFVGWRLQHPGNMRTILRVVHLGIIAALIVTIAYHVVANGSM